MTDAPRFVPLPAEPLCYDGSELRAGEATIGTVSVNGARIESREGVFTVRRAGVWPSRMIVSTVHGRDVIAFQWRRGRRGGNGTAEDVSFKLGPPPFYRIGRGGRRWLLTGDGQLFAELRRRPGNNYEVHVELALRVRHLCTTLLLLCCWAACQFDTLQLVGGGG